MNQIYTKPRYLFLLLGFLICSVGMAQSPLPKNKAGNVQMAIGSPAVTKKMDQVSQKTADPNLNQNEEGSVFLPQSEEKIKGTQLSKAESETVNKQIKESQKFFKQNQSTATKKSTAQDTIGKVKSFAKTSNLTAKNVFEVKKGDFELASSDKMQLKSFSDKQGRSLATYQQLHNSIPVEGAIYKVRESKTKIDAFGQINKKLPTSNSYKVNASTALQNALNTINAKEYVWESKRLTSLVNKKISKKPEGELVYVGPGFSSTLKDTYLAWKFNVFATNPQSSQTIYVDANSGKIILKIDLNRDVYVSPQSIGKGKSRYAGDVVFNTKQYAEGYKLEATQGKYGVPIYTLNMHHADAPDDDIITDYIDEDNNWNDLYNKDRDEAAIDIHWGLQKTIDYYEEKFDRNSVDDQGMTIFGFAHYGTNVENASWTGAWAQFGDGFNKPFVSLGITGHELTHAVTQFSADLIYEGESGAMNESFSDIFGVSIEFYAGKDSKNDIWMLGDELYAHGSLRSMSNPKAQGQPDTYAGENWTNPLNVQVDNGGVHQNSGITNYWYYLLAEGGEGVNDLNNSYSIKAIGLAKAEKIAYITLTEYLSPSSNFSDMRQASLMATEDLYGIGSEEYKQVSNAWYAIGIGAPYSDRQLSIVSVEEPSTLCGPLKGNEPFYVKIENTGSSVIKANDSLYSKLRLMKISFGHTYVLYSNDKTFNLDKDLAVGEQTIIKIQDTIPYEIGASTTNIVEVKLDLKPIEDFGPKEGVSFISKLIVPEGQQDNDLKVLGLNMPDYTGGILASDHQLKITISNLGCKDIPAGTQLKVGYANTLPGSTTIWKEVTLSADFKAKSEMIIPFDGTVDLSAPGLHTYESFLTYSDDPVTVNNSNLNASYNGIVSAFPYTQDFERTPGGWYSKSLATDQKFYFQAFPISFRGIKSKYIWGSSLLSENSTKVGLNADFTLESPIFDFTNVTSPYVEFDLYYLLHRGYDGLIVEYSEDKGQNWKKVEDVNYPEKVHNLETSSEPWFTGINNITTKDPYQMRLNALAGKKVAIRFRMTTDDYADGFLGAFIDNIKVSDAPYDLAVLSSKLDAGKCIINNSNATIITKISNNFATNSQRVNVTTKILDSAQNEVFSKSELTTLNFAKFQDTISYTISNINLKNIGEHTISVSVFPEDMSQDVKQANNAVTFTYDNWNNEDEKVSVLPYKMDFEDADKYKGWRTSENKDAAGWKHGLNTDLESPAWNLEDHTHFMASNDDKCNCDASNDMLVSPVFDLTNYKEAHLTFDGVADSRHISDGYVKVSTDSGETWKEVFHMPYYGSWWEYGVDLSEYAGKSCVQIAFQHNDNGFFANGFAVDNIEIKETKTNLKLSNFSVAENVYEDAPTHEFFVGAKNQAYTTLNKVNLEYQITQNGKAVGAPVSITKNDELLVGQTIVYKIDGLPKLAAGKYEISLKAYIDQEPKDQAQVLKGSFEVIAKTPELTTEAFSDLSSGQIFGSKGFVSGQSDDYNAWKIVTNPDNEYLTVPNIDHTGDSSAKMLYSQLEDAYYNSELVSPMYKLSNTAVALEFYYAMQSNFNDILLVDIKTIGGEWTELWRTTHQGDYVDTEWKKGAMNISKYAGKSVMFRFRHAKQDGYSYMILDDLKIFSDSVTDVSMTILSPKEVCGTTEVKVKLTNEGQVDIAANAIELDLEYLNTSEAISEIVTSGIPVGQSIEYTFKKQPKLDQSGDSHLFNFKAKLEKDLIEDNSEINGYSYQNIAADFKIFDKPVIHSYEGKSFYLDAETNFLANELEVASYKWNTGEVTNNLDVTKSGDYTVTALLKNGCSLTETVKVVFDHFESELPSGNVCGPEVALSPGNYVAYEWFDGSTDPTFVTNESGEYYVTVYNENGLGKIFATSISILENNKPEIQVVDDKKLAASADATTYQWYLNGRPIPNANQKMVATIWEGNYSLEVTNSNGCNSMSDSIDSKGLLIGKLTNAFRVFPNPAVDNVNVFLADKAEGETQMKIYAMDGSVLWSKTYSSMPSNINVSQLTTGVYILDCSVQGKKYTAKIIKK